MLVVRVLSNINIIIEPHLLLVQALKSHSIY